MPDSGVASLLEFSNWETLVGCLQFLQADNVGTAFLEPTEEDREPAIDSVDIEGHDFHRRP
jgi:hypothetical protein